MKTITIINKTIPEVIAERTGVIFDEDGFAETLVALGTLVLFTDALLFVLSILSTFGVIVVSASVTGAVLEFRKERKIFESTSEKKIAFTNHIIKPMGFKYH